MKFKTLSLVLLLTLPSGIVFAQTKPRTGTKPKAAPAVSSSGPTCAEKDEMIKQQAAQIEDLKQQLNTKKEGEEQQRQAAATAALSSSSLSIQAGVIMKSGQVNPVARATFYLLPKSATEIIMTRDNYNLWAGDLSRFGTRTPFEKWSLYEAGLYMTSSVAPNYARAAVEALSTNALQTMVTGFDGIGRFEKRFPAGEYYVFGVTKVGNSTAIWNVKVNVPAGDRSIILDNNNMAL